MDTVSHFVPNLRLQLQNSFFLDLNYCFIFLVWYCLETCGNCVANCVKHKFTLLRSKFYKKKTLMSFYGQFRQLFHISEPTLLKQFSLNSNFCFLLEAPWCLKTYVNCITNWKMLKFYPNPLGHSKKNLDIYVNLLGQPKGRGLQSGMYR